MTSRLPLLLAPALAFGLCCPLAAQESSGKGRKDAGDQPNVKEILQRADAATKAVTAVSYQAEFYGEGDLAERLPRLSGSVKAREPRRSLLGRMVGSSAKDMFRIEAVERKPSAENGRNLKVASDGTRVYRLDEETKSFFTGTLPDAGKLLSPADRLLMIEFLHPTPFRDEINGKSAKYEGRKKISGVECHVIYVVYVNNTESRWFFGIEDYLPRRVDRIVKNDMIEGATILTITALDAAPDLAAADFKLARPKDFAKKQYEPSESPPAPPLLAVGQDAPDWKLATPGGEMVSLKDLRGNVVVLDFWATWCGPCKAAMPAVQQLHEQFKNQPVKVFGVNCWEDGDPAGYMKDNGYTYGLLLGADKVAEAYHVSGIPTFYVINPEGKISYASAGFMPDKEKEIAKIIEKAIERKGASSLQPGFPLDH